MDIIRLVLSPLATNCYIIDAGNSEAAVIDPADDGERILAEAQGAGLAIKKILLTHGHFDHTGAASFIKEKTGAPIYIHKADEEMLSDGVKALAFFTPDRPFVTCSPDTLLGDGDTVTQGDVTFRVISTPGHTAGSVCFLCGGDGGRGVLFSGDTLFKDSIGRTDMYSGSSDTLMRSLDKLRELDGDYDVYPGHGEPTTLAAEKRYNPFLADFI